MPGEPNETRPANATTEIPPDVEERILEILDSTEPGPDRSAAITALRLPAELQHAVTVWLEQDGGQESGFLRSPTTGSDLTTDPGTLPRRLGEYELESVLGKGGMGIVYRARDLRLGRVVALKVLPERFADNPKRLQRFEREIRAVAALRHPSIVPVFVAGQIGDVPYYTMELVAGRSLDKVIGELSKLDQPVSALRLKNWREAIGESGDSSSSSDTANRTYLEAVCNLVIDIADALQHAHDNGVTHRDVKPSNIIAEGARRAKLFDFGLARLDDDLTMTQSSELIGSPHYMSPEQLEGSEIDHRTDIYSLGVTLYELLTLRVPFEFSSPQQVYQSILNREPRRPGLINPQLPKDLETICLTAMEKNADRRFQTAAEFAEDLRRFLRFEPITARPIGSVTRSMRWLRRNRAKVSIVVLLFISLIAIWVTRESTQKTKEVENELGVAKSELETLKQEIDSRKTELERLKAREREQNAALASVTAEFKKIRAEAMARQEEIDTKTRELTKLEADKERLTASKSALETESAKQRADLAKLRKQQETLESERTRLEKEIAAQRGNLDATKTELEKARKQFGTLEQNYWITTINKLLMEARTLRTSNGGLGLILAHEAAVLADRVDTSGDPSLRVRVDDTLLELLRTTQEQLTYTGHSHPVTAIDFSPDGTSVASTSSEGTARIWERATGRPISAVRTGSALVHVEFVADDWLLLASESGAILAWDGRSGSRPVALVNAYHQRQTRTHVAPNGEFIVSHESRLPGLLQVHRRGTDQAERTLGTKDNPIVDFEFGPVRNRIVATTTGGDIEVWGVEDGLLQVSIGGSAALLSASFDAAGRRIASLDARGGVRVIGVADKSVLLEDRIERGRPLGSGRIAFCAGDRRLFVSATGSDHHLLLDPRDGTVLARISAHASARGFDLDRKRLLACVVAPSGGFGLVNTHNGREIAHLGGEARLGPTRHRPVVAFSPDRVSLATVHGETKARIWRAGPGGALQTVGPEMADDFLDSARERLQLARFEPGNGRVLTSSNMGLSSWHLRTGTRFFLAQDPRRPLTPQALAANGDGTSFSDDKVRMFVSGPRPSSRTLLEIGPERVDQVMSWPGGGAGVVLSGDEPDAPRRLLLLDEEGRRRGNLELPFGKAGGGTPLPSPDGSRFVIGYDVLTVVETARPKLRVRLPFSRRPVAFSPDSMRVAASTNFSVKVWNARSGAGWCELSELPSDYSELSDLAFSPDGNRLATAWSDGMIRIHDVSRRRTPSPIAFAAHRMRIHSIRFSKDGTLLLSSSADGTASLWYAADGRRRLTFAPETPCSYAEFSRDDRLVLVVGERRVHVFPVDLRPLAARACPRELTAKERSDFGLGQRR